MWGNSNQFYTASVLLLILTMDAHSGIVEADVRISHIAKLSLPNSVKSFPWLVIFLVEPKSHSNQRYPLCLILSHFPLKDIGFPLGDTRDADPLTVMNAGTWSALAL